MKAWCWRGGQIDFGRTVPDGAIHLITGPAKRIKLLVEVKARHAYDGKTLLVPGVPEADSDDEACDAVMAFMVRLEASLSRRSQVTA